MMLDGPARDIPVFSPRFLRATARERRARRQKRIKGVGGVVGAGRGRKKGAERDEEGIRVAASQRGALPRGPRSFFLRLIACSTALPYLHAL